MDLAQIYDEKLFVDIILGSNDGKRFRVHRLILSSASTVLKERLLIIPRGGQIDLTEANEKLALGLIDLMYKSRISIDNGSLADFIRLLCNLKMYIQIKEYADRFSDLLSTENVFAVWREVKIRQTKKLSLAVLSYIRENREALLDMSYRELKLIIDSDFLFTENEINVFNTVLDWIRHKDNERLKYLYNLICCIRLKSLTLLELEYIRSNSVVARSKKCVSLIDCYINDSSVLSTSISERKSKSKKILLMQDFNLLGLRATIRSHRSPDWVIAVCFGWHKSSTTPLIEFYDPKADEWIVSNEAAQHYLAYHSTISYNDELYIIGAYDAIMPNRKAFKAMNLKQMRWRTLTPPTTLRRFVSSVMLGDFIYAIGGNSGLSRTASVERFDMRSRTWESFEPMQYIRSDAAAVVLRGTIYALGGFDGEEQTNSVEIFDNVSKMWTNCCPMKGARSGLSAVVVNDQIYVFGGTNGAKRLDSCEKYDPVLDSWTRIQNMSFGRSNMSAVVSKILNLPQPSARQAVDDQIYVIGGYNGQNTVNTVERYDTISNQWFPCAGMIIERSGLTANLIRGSQAMRSYLSKLRRRELEADLKQYKATKKEQTRSLF